MKKSLLLFGVLASLSLALSACTTSEKPGVAALTEGLDEQPYDAAVGDGVGAAAYAGPTVDGGGIRSAKPFGGSSRDRQCLMRAMYFESNRSSAEGLLAVGTVVMNRVDSDKFPNRVCDVVGQHKQFAPGVLSRELRGDTSDIEAIAQSVLDGKRHPKIHPDVMFFHTAGLKFPYKNMHYVHVAGGNSFYEKRSRRRR